MFITNAWNFWRLPQYFWRLSGDLSENKRNQVKTNEQLIEFIFICFQCFIGTLVLFFKQITGEISFHNLFSQPNHETGANRATFGCAIFLWYGGASKARFRKRRRSTKNGICVSRMPLCFSFDDGPRRKGKSLAEA